MREWTDSLITCIARKPLSWWNQELTALPIGEHNFSGNIEFGTLGNSSLARIGTKNPHNIYVLASKCPIGRASTARPGIPNERQLQSRAAEPLLHALSRDWAFVDTSHPFQISSGTQNENLSLRLERPSNPELSTIISQGAAIRCQGTNGSSRILQAMVREIFSQISCLSRVGETGLQRALAEMVWTALRDQFEAPAHLAHQDLQRARVKRFIDSRLDDPDLSLESIAQCCGMSLRSLHRAFAADPAGSVSKHLWVRRLDRCAADLRDPTQVHRQVTDICFSWGFNSTSHFSRLFKEQFGVSPRDYRIAFQNASVTQVLNSNHRSQGVADSQFL